MRVLVRAPGAAVQDPDGRKAVLVLARGARWLPRAQADAVGKAALARHGVSRDYTRCAACGGAGAAPLPRRGAGGACGALGRALQAAADAALEGLAPAVLRFAAAAAASDVAGLLGRREGEGGAGGALDAALDVLEVRRRGQGGEGEGDRIAVVASVGVAPLAGGDWAAECAKVLGGGGGEGDGDGEGGCVAMAWPAAGACEQRPAPEGVSAADFGSAVAAAAEKALSAKGALVMGVEDRLHASAEDVELTLGKPPSEKELTAMADAPGASHEEQVWAQELRRAVHARDEGDPSLLASMVRGTANAVELSKLGIYDFEGAEDEFVFPISVWRFGGADRPSVAWFATGGAEVSAAFASQLREKAPAPRVWASAGVTDGYAVLPSDAAFAMGAPSATTAHRAMGFPAAVDEPVQKDVLEVQLDLLKHIELNEWERCNGPLPADLKSYRGF